MKTALENVCTIMVVSLRLLFVLELGVHAERADRRTDGKTRNVAYQDGRTLITMMMKVLLMFLCCCSPYVIGTMNQASSTCHANLQMHHNFRWVLYANHIEPVRSFLGRYLRRQLASRTAVVDSTASGHPGTGAEHAGSALMAVERVVEWLPKLCQRVNRFLESQSNFDITIGTNSTTFVSRIVIVIIITAYCLLTHLSR